MEKASFSLSEKDRINTRGNRAELAAYRLLSQRAYDAEGLRREINNIQLKTQLDPSERLESTDIEGYLAHQQDLIIWTAIGGSRRSAEENVLALQRNWTNTNWASARKNFTESLGRLPQDNSYDGARGGGGVVGLLPFGTTTPSRTGANGNLQAATTPGPSFGGGGGALSALKSPHHSTAKSHNATVKAHTDVITRMNNWIKSNENYRDLYRPITHLKQTLADPQAEVDMKNLDVGKHGFNGYKMCLDILCTMVDESSQAPPKAPGYYSSICFNTSGGTGDHRSMELARNSRIYFENHYITHIDKQVERETGRYEFVPAQEGLVRLSRTKNFVKLQISNRVVSIDPNGITTDDGVPLWPVIYYCIRIGDIYSAQQELKHCLSRIVSSGDLLGQVKCILDLLEYVSLYMRDSTPAAADLSNLPHSLQDCRSILIHSDSHTTDPYLRQILNLLSLFNHEENFLEVYILEDFLWLKLWFITWSQTLNSLGANITSVLPDSSNNTSESILDLTTFANMMMDDNEYGSEYFDKGNAKPFQYAEVLFVSQRFGEAILYLWERRQILPSIHLMCVCLYYGLILPHDSLSSTSTTPHNLIHHWIEKDVKGTFGFDLGVCVQYILVLNSNWKAHLMGIVDTNEIDCEDKKSSTLMSNALIQLIKSSSLDQIQILTGDVNKSGVREGGLLDSYYSQTTTTFGNNQQQKNHQQPLLNTGSSGEDEINSLIMSAARICKDEDPDSFKAFYLYQLAGQYGYACHVACEQLSGVVFMNWSADLQQNSHRATYKTSSNPSRDAIRKRCSDFYRKVESRASFVSQSIQNTNHDIYMNVLYKLLEICDALDHFVTGEYEQAKIKIKNLGLFPFHEIDVNSAADLYEEYPDFLHRVGDNTVIMLMTCLKEEFKKVRSSGGGMNNSNMMMMSNRINMNNSSGGVNVSPLEAIKTQADVLVLFCDKIKPKLKKSNTIAILNAMKDEFYR